MGENAKCFATLSTLVLVIYYAFTFLFQEKSRQFYGERHKKTQTHSLPLKSYLLQNALLYAPKCNAICTKTQCYLLLNATLFAAFYPVTSGKPL
jgi:hypothetical protein